MRLIFDGIIIPDFTGKFGIEIEDGIVYIINYSRKNIKIMRIVKFIQKFLWSIGIAIHDPIFGECTPDFNCCVPEVKDGKYTFINISQKRIEKWINILKVK